uniref:Ovule protein n=1 Tax=Mesocestoides corti TaxID=53468 RepID=A0A5K3G5B5_MESCO
ESVDDVATLTQKRDVLEHQRSVVADSSSTTWSPRFTRWSVGVHHMYVIRNFTQSHEPTTSTNLVVSPTCNHLHPVSDQSQGIA